MLDIVPGTGTKNKNILDSTWEVIPTGLLMHSLWRVKGKGKSRLAPKFMI